MAQSAVAIPLTGKNLVPQGVRDATAPQQQAVSKLTKQQVESRLQNQSIQGFAKMKQLIAVSSLMLQYMHSNPNEPLNNPILAGYVHHVKNFASSLGERTDLLGEFKGLLEKVRQDTAVICTRTEQPAKSSVSTGLSSDSAILWKTVQAHACKPDRAELGMDCEIVVKIRDHSERAGIRKLQPVDLVKHAERARAEAAKSTPRLPLAGLAYIAARQLPSGDISLGFCHVRDVPFLSLRSFQGTLTLQETISLTPSSAPFLIFLLTLSY
ncbi:hypothetical protein N7533_000022 [Penicillium manginii]|uniref:uncharacterized protein n=1 Tax=Penicillium manginii TaxID=203109 RepID=UPI002547B483|nr:uncharacterized protein N7533_000022 [Penicillium manginii]KAJ5767439.1 hypothetical protein N7533_000022 [Penicillium manginii]